MRLSPAVIERYFEPVDNDEDRIDPGLRDSMQFTRANLIDAPEWRAIATSTSFFAETC